MSGLIPVAVHITFLSAQNIFRLARLLMPQNIAGNAAALRYYQVVFSDIVRDIARPRRLIGHRVRTLCFPLDRVLGALLLIVV